MAGNAMKIIDIACGNLSGFGASELDSTRASPLTLTVRADSPAVGVADIMDLNDHQLAIVLDDSGAIAGYVNPIEVRSRISQHLGISGQSFADVLSDLAKRPEEQARGFKHEWLITDRIGLFWCDRGKHFTGKRPCQFHP